MATPEGAIKRKLAKMLKDEGVWSFPPQAGPYGSAGLPDRILCVYGELVGVECKADSTKQPTKLQLLCRDQIVAAGGKWFLVFDEFTLSVLRAYIVNRRREKRETETVF